MLSRPLYYGVQWGGGSTASSTCSTCRELLRYYNLYGMYWCTNPTAAFLEGPGLRPFWGVLAFWRALEPVQAPTNTSQLAPANFSDAGSLTSAN